MKKENQSQPAEEVQEKDSRRNNRSMGILTVDASGILAQRETGDTAWHELVNAYRTRKILSGDLGGIERLEGGWVVAVVYYLVYETIRDRKPIFGVCVDKLRKLCYYSGRWRCSNG